MTISQRIFEELKKQGKKQKELADYIGLSTSAISDWKKKGTNPAAENISAIANFLNISTDYLLTGKEKSNTNISNSTVDEQEQEKERLPTTDKSINFSTDTDFSNATLYNVTGDDTTISPNIPEASAKEYEKFSNIIEYIQSLSEREQWKAIFRMENILKEEYPIDSVKKTLKEFLSQLFLISGDNTKIENNFIMDSITFKRLTAIALFVITYFSCIPEIASFNSANFSFSVLCF